MSVAQWAFWLAVAALVAAAGKFLDDYHIKTATKTRMRDALVSWFLWLDARKVPDLGGLVLGALRGIFRIRRLPLLIAGLVFVYWATLSAFYLGREIFSPTNDESYVDYLLTWIPFDYRAPFWLAFLAAIIVPALLGLIAMAYCFHRASMTSNDASRLGLLGSGLILGLLLGLSGAILAFIGFKGGGYFFGIILLAGLASVALPALLAICTLLLILIRYGIRLIRFLLLKAFDVASSPAVSPFTYAASLLGVIILAAKVLQAAVTS
jgi:hypothetical protein